MSYQFRCILIITVLSLLAVIGIIAIASIHILSGTEQLNLIKNGETITAYQIYTTTCYVGLKLKISALIA